VVPKLWPTCLSFNPRQGVANVLRASRLALLSEGVGAHAPASRGGGGAPFMLGLKIGSEGAPRGMLHFFL
jgi:hypothetical protein